MTIGQFRALVKELNGNKIKNEIDKIQHKIDKIQKMFDNTMASSKKAIEDTYKDPNKVETNNGTVFVGIHQNDASAVTDEAAREAGKKYELDQLGKEGQKGQKLINALNTITKHISKLYDECIKQYQFVASDVTKMLKTSVPGGTSNNKIGRPADSTVSVESAYLV